MYRLIIDSGATKTEWVLVEKHKKPLHFFTDGINANYLSDNEITSIISKFSESVDSGIIQNISHIHYYGAGCGNATNLKRLRELFQNIFPDIEISIYTDLLGACHSLCGTNPGWVVILGTGSNACFYNGEKITDTIPSLGYLLGDEGSGSYLGKTFLAAYLLKQFPEDLQSDFEKTSGLNYDLILKQIYQQPKANHFMASFAPYIARQLSHPFVRELCLQAFSDFFDKQITLHKSCDTLHICGSIGFHFREIIERIAQEKGIKIEKIVASPIQGLIEYYQKEE